MSAQLDCKIINGIKKEADSFLSSYGMNYSDIEQEKYIGYFLEEMQEGLAGSKQSSLKMLPTFIEYKDSINIKKQVIALDAGGTNLRSAVVSFNRDLKPELSNIKKTDMPGVERAVSKEEFFNTVVENIKDILNYSDNIGFVFSYPIEIFPDRDGKLINFTKEIKAPEVEGEFIGKNLLNAIRKKGLKSNKKIVLLNDTVASLLSGIAAFQERRYESYIGIVLGTGMNACYIEKNSNILKIKSYNSISSDGFQLINTEAGNFSKGPSGKIDKLFDKKTLNPGSGTFEKMFSGAYLGGLATEVLKVAAGDGLFSVKISRIFKKMDTLESRAIDDYLYFPPVSTVMAQYLNRMEQKDRVFIYFLFENLIERAAILASIVLASLMIKTGKGFDPCNPVCIVAEGSSFYKMNNFRSRVDHYLSYVLKGKNRFCNTNGSYFYEINRIEDAVMLGASVAANLI